MFRRIAMFKGKIDFIPGVFAAFKRKVFEEEKFCKSKVEDYAFSEKIRDKFRITYDPEAIAYTIMPENLKSLYRQRKYWALGNIEELYKKNNLKKLFAYYYLAVLDIIILILSFLSGNFIPLALFFAFESLTMITANRKEKGNCNFESLIFPFFMYFLAFFYLIVYISAFIEFLKAEK